ncbi:ABC transporter permease [Parasulfuritortus cantonensis]|uniref:ABC transporter permease n=2 Tax=Parasulfuritortus cantonensis TaxID=2528202 RepID=A0A4R1BCK3_9PROT|nr:ABC transporter permease [Parasulfuritortus cantonensis]
MLIHNRLRAAGVAWPAVELSGFDADHLALIRLVTDRLAAPAPTPPARFGFLARLGERVSGAAAELPGMLALLGQISEGLLGLLRRPAGFRMREFFVQLQSVGLGALPIVAMMTFLIGVVFAYLLGIQIEKYGANIFIVDGVSLAIARELSPMLVAVLVAGRSGAAFTAQIGAMKVTEEIDAIATLGLSPIKVLVLPRLLAIVVAMPLLSFFGDLMGVLGAATVAASQLDITLHTFFTRMRDVLPLDTVTYGLSKAPAFAVAIAFIACRNGFAVSRDARSVGERTTATVVTSLMAVILINALYAILNPAL